MCAFCAHRQLKKFAWKYPERLGFLYTDMTIETYEKPN